MLVNNVTQSVYIYYEFLILGAEQGLLLVQLS